MELKSEPPGRSYEAQMESRFRFPGEIGTESRSPDFELLWSSSLSLLDELLEPPASLPFWFVVGLFLGPCLVLVVSPFRLFGGLVRFPFQPPLVLGAALFGSCCKRFRFLLTYCSVLAVSLFGFCWESARFVLHTRSVRFVCSRTSGSSSSLSQKQPSTMAATQL